MSNRWWAPTRGTIAPDAVVLALLTPDGDPAGDLGASLLGLHRAGAASCEFVAKGAVPSEFDLVKALTSTNTQLSAHLSSAVSKSLEPNYAGLLIRDVIEDADASALSLFRSCVAKGVAPPLAASRVGAVYGVPSRELGKYAVLATDPKANPVALTDAADRVLLGYVSKLVASEVGGAKEEVSKAPTAFVEADVRRDQGGRFTFETGSPPVKTPPTKGPLIAGDEADKPKRLSPFEQLRARLGLGRTTAPAVVVEPEPEPPKPARTGRIVRTKTSSRIKRSSRVKDTSPLTTPGTKLTSSHVRLTTSTTPLTVAQVQLQAQTFLAVRQQLGVATKDVVDPKRMRALADESLPKTNFMTIPQPGADPLPEMHASLIWHVPSKASAEFLTDDKMVGTAMQDSPRRFRMEYFLKFAGQPAEHDLEGVPKPHSEEMGNREAAAQAAIDDMPVGYIEPIVQRMDWVKYEDMDDYHAVLAQEANIAAEHGFKNEDLGREMSEMEPVQDYYNGVETVVYRQPTVDPDTGESRNRYSRPVPIVDEFALSYGDAIRGVDERGSEMDVNTDWTLDPNQAVKLSENFLTFWDDRNKVLVHRWLITPIDENQVAEHAATDKKNNRKTGTSKALTMVAEPEVTFDEHEHPRDEEGRFSSKGRSLVAPTAVRAPSKFEQMRAELGLTAFKEKPVPEMNKTPEEFKRVLPSRVARVSRGRGNKRIVRTHRESAPARFTASSVKLQLKEQNLTVVPMTALETKDITLAIKEAMDEGMSRSVSRPVDGRKNLADLPALSDQSHFKVFTAQQWDRAMEVVDTADANELLETPGAMIPFRGLARARIAEGGMSTFMEARDNLLINAADDLYKGEGEIKSHQVAGPFDMADPKAIGRLIKQTFDENDKLDHIEVKVMVDSTDGHRYGRLMGNRLPLATQYMVQIDPELRDHLDDPNLQLVSIGRFRAKNVRIDAEGELHPLTPLRQGEHYPGFMSPQVQIFRVINPEVSVWRAVQD